MPLKVYFPDVRFSGNMVTPDEIDRYEQYVVVNPTTSATHFGSATAGTVSQVVAIGLGNTRADFPRNIAAVFSGSAALSGTVAITGKNQFGVSITESVGLSQGTQIVGTAVGTSVFAQVTAATATFGTGAIGSGTISLGVDIAAATHLFGLPAKIGAVTDIKAITWSNSTGLSIPINGGTVASSTYANTANHWFRGSALLAGTMTLTALFKPSFAAESLAKMANL